MNINHLELRNFVYERNSGQENVDAVVRFHLDGHLKTQKLSGSDGIEIGHLLTAPSPVQSMRLFELCSKTLKMHEMPISSPWVSDPAMQVDRPIIQVSK